MKISILICVHSTDSFHDNLLIESLNSLNKQTYKDFDVFIVFDECWQHTNDVVNDQKYFFVINRLYHNKKQGLAIAKNFGLNYIKSDWIGFLDADDLYVENKLERQVEFIKNNQVDFLGTLTLYKINNNFINYKQMYPWWKKYETNEEIIAIINKENILTHGSMLIRKYCLDNLNGYSNIKGMEDWDLWKRAIEKNYIFYQIQENLYVYTVGTSVAR
jgi:glycosyltransferase involved in cell wall biosynthesis